MSGRPLDANDLLPGVLPEPLGLRHMHPVYRNAMLSDILLVDFSTVSLTPLFDSVVQRYTVPMLV